jgi:uncharacterized protein YdaL
MKALGTTFLIVFATSALGAPLTRPLSAKGAAARTLLMYSDTRAPYSLSEGLEVLRLQLSRVATQVEGVAITNVTPEQISAADYLVVFCPQSRPLLPTNVLHSLTNLERPLLWVGFGASELEDLPPFQGQFVFSKLYTEKSVTNITWREKTWKIPVYPWIPVRLGSNSTSQLLMTVEEQGRQRPLAWRFSNATLVATVPLWGTASYLFSDLLLDFYGVTDIPESRLFLRLEDYHAHSDHRQFQRAADYLHARGIPFMVATTPSWLDPEFGLIENLGSTDEFVNGLRYAQQRGGRLVMKGCLFDQNKIEFWDTATDHPVRGQSVAQYRGRVQESVRLMLKHGLFPLAWETPGAAASRQAYTAVAEVFSTGVERLQLSDATSRETYVTSGLTTDRYGRLIIPENGGYALMTSSNSLDTIRETLDVVTSLRGTVGGCYIHCYQPLAKITALVDLLQSYKLPFLDLVDMDNAVQLPGALLLSGNARRTVELRGATIQSRTFLRSGKEFGTQREGSPYTGQRTFRRIDGDYVLIEFTTPSL